MSLNELLLLIIYKDYRVEDENSFAQCHNYLQHETMNYCHFVPNCFGRIPFMEQQSQLLTPKQSAEKIANLVFLLSSQKYYTEYRQLDAKTKYLGHRPR